MGIGDNLFKFLDSNITVSFVETLRGNFSCLILLFVVEIQCARGSGNFKAGLNKRCSDKRDISFSLTGE